MAKIQAKPFWLITTAVLITAFLCAFLAIEYTIKHTPPPQQTEQIGGEFQLISPAGSIVNDGIFRGRWMFMYFGATRCPYNQCQKDLIKMGQVMDLLKDKKSSVAPIFISFDNKYDTPDRLLLAMKPLNNRIIALTGGELALRDVSILYHVPIQTTEVNGLQLIQPYNQFILMNPNGIYQHSIPVDKSPEMIAKEISNLIDSGYIN